MYLVMIAWFYVAFMMAVAEAFSPVGSVLGAVFTFMLYGMLPMAVIGYILNSPARRRARRAREAATALTPMNAVSSNESAPLPPDADSHAAGDAIAPVRKEL